MRQMLWSILFLTVTASSAAEPQAVPEIEFVDEQLSASAKLLLRRNAYRLISITADSVVLAATEARNANPDSMENIHAIDRRWQDGVEEQYFSSALMNNDCSQQLRTLAPASQGFDEAFVVDAQGRIVCMTSRTSDYWQADEAKWQVPFLHGKILIDRVQYDDSANRHLAQISLPISNDQGEAIGTLTVGKTVAPATVSQKQNLAND